MPLYLCNSLAGSIKDEAKQKIAVDITRIHCALTNAPAKFVHAFFLEEAPNHDLMGKSICLTGNIRAGRTDEQKEGLVSQMLHSIETHTGVASQDAIVNIIDTPASWVMEGGEVFPEPGEEEEWLAKYEARLAEEAVR